MLIDTVSGEPWTPKYGKICWRDGGKIKNKKTIIPYFQYRDASTNDIYVYGYYCSANCAKGAIKDLVLSEKEKSLRFTEQYRMLCNYFQPLSGNWELGVRIPPDPRKIVNAFDSRNEMDVNMYRQLYCQIKRMI